MPATRTQSVGGRAAAVGWYGVSTTETDGEVAALTLDDRGIVCDYNPAGEALFRFRRSELVWRHVSMLLPQLAGIDLVKNGQLNPHLRFVSRIGGHFQAVTQDNECFSSELFLNLLDSSGHCRLSLIVRPVEVAVS